MSQHTYTLKFTIGIDKAEDGTYPIHGEEREIKHELLSQVLNAETGETKEDNIKAEIEERIKKVIPTQKGIIRVNFDSLEES